jgi:hypothetical protein
MTRKATPIQIVLTFLALTAVLSSFFYAIVIYTGNLWGGGNNMLYAIDLQWSVAVAALLTCWLLGENLGDLGWRWGKARYMAAAYFIPLFYCAIAYGVVWISGFGHFYNRQFVAGLATTYGLGGLSPAMLIAMHVFFSMTGTLIAAIGGALGEEIGWRGLLVPQLQTFQLHGDCTFLRLHSCSLAYSGPALLELQRRNTRLVCADMFWCVSPRFHFRC